MVVNEKGQHTDKVSLEYTSIGCNSSPQALDWGRNGIIAYGGSHSVVLYNPESKESAGKVINILNAHQDRVNCVQWIQDEKGENSRIISGSSDKTAIIWEHSIDQQKWIPRTQLSGHTGPVCYVAGLNSNGVHGILPNSKCLLCTASADSTVRIWNFSDKQDVECLQILEFGSGFALALAITVLPETRVPILAIGSDDTTTTIYLWSVDRGKGEFKQTLKLQGHEDWIRAIAFTSIDDGSLLLASGGQDCFIRVWKIQRQKLVERKDEVRLPEKTLPVMEKAGDLTTFTVTLETVLSGHEGWVYGLSLNYQRTEDGPGRISLLSASMDKTVMLWEPSEDLGLWIDKARMGEVGGNTLGFYGCCFSPDGRKIIAHGFQGAFHLWARPDGPEGRWTSDVTVGGHFGSVEDLDWDPQDGTFLISVSSDQTARLHGPWTRKDMKTTWHEIARPQIHGYDLQCIALIDRYLYAAGAEEKVTRVFRAPRKFHECISNICGIEENEKVADSLPLGATVPPLGLSNKAVFEGDLESWKVGIDDVSQPMKASAFASEDPLPFTPVAITAPPPEDILLQNTLWPEEQKLYGHGYEVFCLATDRRGTILASACKATKEEHANILLWDTKSWVQLGSLNAHTLTVTQMAFSKSGNMLLSVSRDRTWALFKRNENTDGCPFSLVQKTTKKSSIHSRIIWSCAWSYDDRYFITGSRDKKVIMWELDETSRGATICGEPFLCNDAVTAVDIAPQITQNRSYLVAIGTENGSLLLLAWNKLPQPNWSIRQVISKEYCPVLTVKRLKWCQRGTHDKDAERLFLKLACGSADGSVRIINVEVLAK